MLPILNLDALKSDLIVFIPEAILCCAIVGLLLTRMLTSHTHLGPLSLIALLAALTSTVLFWIDFDFLTKSGTLTLSTIQAVPAFTGMVAYDTFLVYARCVILSAASLTMILA